MKKVVKICIIIAVLLIIGIGALIINGFSGNPVSKMLAKKAAQEHLNEHYSESDVKIEDVFYNFKDGNYHVDVKSPSSVDTHFAVWVSPYGRVSGDDYEDVTSGWNTHERIDEEYRQLVNEIFSNKNFPLTSDIDFGSLAFYEDAPSTEFTEPDYGLKLSELELDKEYDVKELAKTSGQIVYYSQDDDISFSKAADNLLTLKEELGKSSIPFYAIDFTLEKPRNNEGYDSSSPVINVVNFLYDDIYEEGLEERIEKAHEALMKHYEAEDAKGKEAKID